MNHRFIRGYFLFLDLLKNVNKNSDLGKYIPSQFYEDGKKQSGSGGMYSLKVNTDSAGNTLTEQQQEYFKDSKVRDDKGHLKPMYHGTTYFGEITKFKTGKKGYLGPAIYLAEEKKQAQRYADSMGYGNGTVYEVYANAKNPLIVTTDNPTKEILNFIYGNDKIYNKRKAKQSYDVDIITKTDIKKLQDKGYDSIKWEFGYENELAVFSSNQIKRIDNKTPTDSDDIRYSEKVYPYDGETSKSRGIRKTAVYEFADSLGDMFNIVDRNGRDGMRKEAYRIADRVEKFGYITKADMDNFFDAAYQNARFTDDKSEYKDVKKRIRTAGIVPLRGREYLDFLRNTKAKSSLKTAVCL